MTESYGELVTRLCWMRDQLKKTPEGQKALLQVRRELEDLCNLKSEYGGLLRAMTSELKRVRKERDAAVRRGGNGNMKAQVHAAAPKRQAAAADDPCRGCEYKRKTSGLSFCDYAGITGRPRTVYRGQKVDFCPRKQQGNQG